eukprot:CAMPEP_0172176280 /NCGR_PEP_ID=MMETSP1050-20130122/14709_1 /TAXON_ID=233186 /ORGANISM="Cryptomonas curvata, Strain CCAP979/52" /LENGTH=234 /DNA_ID=CAMNT_0012848503 /DNA_START=8 /DNA_END=712 /DNA_ORIENTATION=+
MDILDIRDIDSSAKLSALITVLSRCVTKMNENGGEAGSSRSSVSETSSSNSIDESMPCADAPDIEKMPQTKRKYTDISSCDTNDKCYRDKENYIHDGPKEFFGYCKQFTEQAKPTVTQTTCSKTSHGLQIPWDECIVSFVCRHGQQNSQCKECCGSPIPSHGRHKGMGWTREEDLMLMEQLRAMRGGVLSAKNMTMREAERIRVIMGNRTSNAVKFRWNDKLKKEGAADLSGAA